MILPQAILDAPPLGCFNLHASLLPRWRGAAPIHRAIMAGDAETGVMVMKMDEGLDTGAVAMAERVADYGCDDRRRSARCAGAARRRADGARDRRAGARHAAADAAERRRRHLRRQDRQGRGADRLEPSRRARCCDHSRGLSPFPGAWCEMPIDGEPVRVKVLRCDAWPRARARRATCSTISSRSPAAKARCGFSNCSAPARQPMQAEEFLRGTPLQAAAAASADAPLQAHHRI